MSLDSITKSDTNSPTRSRAWLLPFTLIIGFALVFLLLFGKKLLPATEVITTPVITLRLSPNEKSSSSEPSPNSKQLLFQATGWIEPDPYTTYVPTLTDGIVDKVLVLEGQAVKKDQLLATLISDDAQLNLQQAQEQVKSMQARIYAHCASIPMVESQVSAAQKKILALNEELKELKDKESRLNRLSKSAVSQQNITSAKLQVTRQQAIIEQSQAEIPQLEARLKQIKLERTAMESNLTELEISQERAQLTLTRTQIKSPMNGLILKLHAAPGKKRLTGMDDPNSVVIVELYDPNKLQARIDVPLTEAAALSVNQSVTMTSDLLPNQTFRGTVTRITGKADIQRNTLQVKVAIENPDQRLRPGMLIRGKFYPQSTPSDPTVSNNPTTNNRLALFVPTTALIDKNNNEAKLWTMTPNKTAILKTVTISNLIRDTHTQVTKGIRSGENVILPPHHNLKEGSRLTVSQP